MATVTTQNTSTESLTIAELPRRYEILDGVIIDLDAQEAIVPKPLPELYEIIDGQVVEKPPMGSYSTEVASMLCGSLEPFARKSNLGRVLVEPMFRVTPKRHCRPDVAFFSYQNWPRTPRLPDAESIDRIPELAVEVLSASNTAVEVLAKVRTYFEAGVKAVWLVYPTLAVIHVFDGFTAIRVLTRADHLEGGELFPGFRLPLSELFELEDAVPASETKVSIPDQDAASPG
jgi:Uma2 family endonuclease